MQTLSRTNWAKHHLEVFKKPHNRCFIAAGKGLYGSLPKVHNGLFMGGDQPFNVCKMLAIEWPVAVIGSIPCLEKHG